MAKRIQSDLLAAIDLGSNSFHMVIAKVVGGELQIIDRLKEPVRLASGLKKEGGLDSDAKQRALGCLERFGQRLKQFDAKNVRAVGTNTLRAAQKKRRFLNQAQEALGFPIDISDGHEEARLIYVGVSQTLAYKNGRRLVVDIGGGSTECIIGKGHEPVLVDSLYMGCVSFTNQYFQDGLITQKKLMKAKIAAEQELHPIERSYRKLGWQEAVGASGTIKAVEAILNETGWSACGITNEGLDLLWDYMVEAGQIDLLNLPGLQADRAQVLPGGVAILKGVFELLKIETMQSSPGALREGILHELFGRIRHDDLREASVQRLCERYNVDMKHAASVEDTALSMMGQAPPDWELSGTNWELILGWAARLHEIGLALSYSGYHKHSAYLIMNSDIPGFSRQELGALALVVSSHRRKIRKTIFEETLTHNHETICRLVGIFRLAVLLNRGRSRRHVAKLELQVDGEVWHLAFKKNWLEEHPLTYADLEAEKSYLEVLDIQLTW
jgi:exopolyphosphatase/guanosine-5'-triphosphate,3'-diphosphate pyrophosphatase